MGFIIWIFSIIATGVLASQKGRSVVGWVIASVFFVFIPLIILVFLDSLNDEY